GSDAGKIRAIEDCILERAGVEKCLPLATVGVEIRYLRADFARTEHVPVNPLDRVLQRPRSSRVAVGQRLRWCAHSFVASDAIVIAWQRRLIETRSIVRHWVL